MCCFGPGAHAVEISAIDIFPGHLSNFLLALHRPASKGYDRYWVLMLRRGAAACRFHCLPRAAFDTTATTKDVVFLPLTCHDVAVYLFASREGRHASFSAFSRTLRPASQLPIVWKVGLSDDVALPLVHQRIIQHDA